MMKWSKSLLAVLLVLLMAACSGNNLEKMIPADATGVVAFDVPKILEETGLVDDGKIVLPETVRQAVDDNDTSPLCILLNDLPQMGIDADSKAYAFFSSKSFSRVLLANLDDASKARKTLELRVGGDFDKVEGIDCMYVRDKLYAIDGDVLLVGTVSKPMDVNRAAKAAKGILSKTATNITDNKDVIKLLRNSDYDINMWLQGKSLKTILNKSDVYRELSQRFPLVEIFTESDIDAVTCNVDLDEKEVKMETRILAKEDSEYARLLTSTIAKPTGDVLKAIPNSMDYIFSMSIKGENFVQLEQIKQVLQMFGNLPYIGRIDLAKILTTIDGPFSIGLARDPHLEGEWNMVLAARSTDPDAVVRQISTFANSMGQAPELYEGEYIYQYDNKMIRVGITDGILYVKVLDYEQTEGYAYEMQPVREFFDGALLGFFAQSRSDSVCGYLDFGLQDIFNGKGRFYTNQPTANASQEFLRALCGIKVHDTFGNEETDEDGGDIAALLTGSSGNLHPVN